MSDLANPEFEFFKHNKKYIFTT